MEGEHLLPREDVVSEPVLHKIGVFHGTDSDSPGHLLSVGGGEIGILLGDDGESALDRLVEETAQFDVFPGAGLHYLAVLA